MNMLRGVGLKLPIKIGGEMSTKRKDPNPDAELIARKEEEVASAIKVHKEALKAQGK